jgi:hypothetical protein
MLAVHNYCCEKIPNIDNLKWKGLLSAWDFRDFSPWPAGFIAFRSVARQKYNGGKVW